MEAPDKYLVKADNELKEFVSKLTNDVSQEEISLITASTVDKLLKYLLILEQRVKRLEN